MPLANSTGVLLLMRYRLHLPAFALACALLLPAPAPAAGPLTIGGALILEYADRAGGNDGIAAVMQAGRQHGQMRLSQLSLNFHYPLTDYARTQFTAVSGGGAAPVISEVWLEWQGLPYDGFLTIGRFYKPNGAPLQTANLSYPALMFHAATVVGVKAAFEYYPWRTEVGVVNNNDLRNNGAMLSNTRAFARTSPPGAAGLAGSNNKEVYAMIGWRDGGDWGSLDVNVTGTFGHIREADQNVFQPFVARGINNEEDRANLDVVVDYQYGPWRLYGEYVLSDEGPLDLRVWNVGGSYRHGRVNYALGYDRLENNTSVRPKSNPESWRRKRYTASATYDYTSDIQFILEVERSFEFYDVTPFEKDGLDNDAVVAQIVTRF